VDALLKFAGLAWLAAVWLPMSLFGRPAAGDIPWFGVAQPPAAVLTADTSSAPSKAVQFNPVRVATVAACNAKNSGSDAALPGGQFRSPNRRPAAPSWLSSSPSDWLQTWQFACRTALPPRAPC